MTLHAEKRFEVFGTFVYYTTKKTAKEAEKELKQLEIDMNKASKAPAVIKLEVEQVSKMLF